MNSLARLRKPNQEKSAEEIYERSVIEAKKVGYKEIYWDSPGLKDRFVGHGTSVGWMELPFIEEGKSDVLAPAVTIALEPKLCFQDEFAAEIESVFLVTNTGDRLIGSVPVDIFMCCAYF